jgi:acetyl esterase
MMRWGRWGRRRALWGVIAALALLFWTGWARPFRQPDRVTLPPDYRNIHYGPHERNVFDLWKAKPQPGDAGPTPVVVFFHGGGFRKGDKSSVSARLVTRCLAAGISVASANYRLSQSAPFPAQMHDGARVIQFLRYHAAEFGIDPDRIAASGSSAGAGIALWIGFHDDLADPTSDDRVARQSTRLLCMGVDGAQCSYDPRFIKMLVGGRAHEHPALPQFYGVGPEESLDSPRVCQLAEEASPINYVSAGDPPVIAFYAEPNLPLSLDDERGDGIHHPRFGTALKDRMDRQGVGCIVRHENEYPFWDDRREDMYRDMVAFFVRRFGL